MRRVSSRFRWTIWSRSELLEFSVRLMGHASWPFDEPPDVAVFTVWQVIEEGEPILLVSHDEHDGAWQFISGRRPAEGDAQIVALREIWRHDPTVGDLVDLPLGWVAWRQRPGQPWQRSRRPKES